MSIIFKREHGYPVDLELRAIEKLREEDHYLVKVFIDGEWREDLGFYTPEPHADRRIFSMAFFAGYTYAENKRA